MRLVVVLAIAACGGGSPERAACEQLAKVCSLGMTDTHVDLCRQNFANMRGTFGDDRLDRMLSCTSKAETCSDAVACGNGLLDSVGGDVGRPTAAPKPDIWGDRDRPLPPECKRANDVCADDEPFARHNCREVVGNLKADAAHLGELTACYAKVVNCYAFERCTSRMRMKLLQAE